MNEKIERNIRVLLVDDQEIFVQSLATCIENYAQDIDVLDIAQNGEEAIQKTIATNPDIIVMDVRMPILDGVEAVKHIKRIKPEIKIIMLSTYKEDEYVRNALIEGASGYLLKNITPQELIATIRALYGGISVVSPEILKDIIKPKETFTQKNHSWLESLTKREREIALLLIDGYSNEQISKNLNLAIQTVRNQVSSIYFKLDVKDRLEMIRISEQE